MWSRWEEVAVCIKTAEDILIFTRRGYDVMQM